MRGLEPRLSKYLTVKYIIIIIIIIIKTEKIKADALLIFSVFIIIIIIIIIYFTVKYLLNLGSSPLIRFVIYK